MLHGAAFVDFHFLDIGIPFAPCMAVGVRNIVAARLAFSAYHAFV